MKTRILMMTLAIFACAVAAQAGLVYNAAADFSTTNNPNGAWTYASFPADPGVVSFAPLQALAPLPGYSDIVGWCNGGGAWADPAICKNTTDTTISAYGIDFAPGMFSLGGGDYVTDVRWTCQVAGTYDVDITLTGVQNNGTTSMWLMQKNTTGAWWDYVQGGAGFGSVNHQVDHLQIDFAVGDTWDICSWGGQHTRVDATFTQVPEPGTLALLVCGLVGLSVFAWKKRK